MKTSHNCAEFPTGSKDYEHDGPAIGSIDLQEETGRWVASSDGKQYGTCIRFCPFCGVELAQDVEKTKP